jgi:hypothetical protein
MPVLAKTLLVVSVVLIALGCHSKLYTHTDPEYKISISYPGNVDLFDDKERLLQESGQKAANRQAVDHPELLFALVTMGHGQLTCALHQLPEGSRLSAEEYYQASTARELASLEAEILEEKSDMNLDDKTFQVVGFRLRAGDRSVRSRIYQYLPPESGRILVFTASALDSNWDSEIPVMESILASLKVDW